MAGFRVLPTANTSQYSGIVTPMIYAKTLALALLPVLLVIQGCATASRNVGAIYTPPSHYQGYNCAQLAEEFQHNRQRAQVIGGRLDKSAHTDGLISTVGAALFFPALLLVGGSAEQESEFAVLKGQAEAMHQAAFGKKCTAIDTKTLSSPTP
jgi:hypothetical protein